MSASAAGRREPRRTTVTRIDIEGEAPRHGSRGGGSHGPSSCTTEDSDSAERGWNGAERRTLPERKTWKEERNIWARNGAVPQSA